MSIILLLISIYLVFHLTNGSVLKILQNPTTDDEYYSDDFMHPTVLNEINYAPLNSNRFGSDYDLNMSKQFVEDQINKKLNKNIAKNVILFLGDGMSVTTLAATRVFLGGEETSLSFERFQDVGMAKTYCVDGQVADSACTATAYLSGIKANYGTLGVNAKVRRYDCYAGADKRTHTESIGKWALDAGKSIGIVTTTHVTDASPAGVYAHLAERYWETNVDILMDHCNDTLIDDVAKQLVHGDVGSRIKVIFGGGRKQFRDVSMRDEEGKPGRRTDRRDLIKEWKNNKAVFKRKEFVWNKEGLANIKPEDTDAVLGLFDASEVKYNHEVDGISDIEPTLSEMTLKAIEILRTNENGFFLFVEGGLIDFAHHDGKAHKAISETAELAKSVGLAEQVLGTNDTLMVVTADHSHTLSYSGYSNIGNNIFGTAGRSNVDHLPFLKLSYANGPAFGRTDPTNMALQSIDLVFPSAAPTDSESHGGDDVAVFANGPYSHLFRGTFEQNVIPHIMAYAACIGNGLKACD